MKVILLKDVARIGQKNDVKDVPSGHALNFLIPQKLAEPATPASLKRLETAAEKKSSEQEASLHDFEAALAKIKETALTMTVSANEQGHLYEAIKESDISAHLKGEGVEMPEACIELTEPVKEVGSVEITLKKDDITSTATLTVAAKE